MRHRATTSPASRRRRSQSLILRGRRGLYARAEAGRVRVHGIAAAVLGGASLAGGRGSFFGTMLAAFFLTEIDNVLPLFQQPSEYADMAIGVLILLVLVLYQTPELLARARAARQRAGRLSAAQSEAPAA